MATLRTGPRTELTGLAVVMLVAAGLRLWRLEDNGFGNEYYAAGVRSMLQSGWLFFYNAFDPAGLVSLDKPPLAFWIQTLSASVLGYDGWSILMPQALAGTASVAILYGLVRHPFGRAAGLIAALLLAISPIVVAVDRSNNTDSWLNLFLLLAAWLALRGRGLSLVFAMAALGLAFNVKMLAALICGPALLAGWWFAGTLDWRQRLRWMTAGGVAFLLVALSWSVVFDLTPAESRPQAGSSKGNSMLELMVRHNGLERFVLPTRSTPSRPPAARAASYDAVPVGPLRLAHPMLASQIAWALPLALLGGALAWRRRRAPVALWTTWALLYGIVYSAAGGIFHLYYLATLAPPLAALAGIGCMELWRRGYRHLAFGLTTLALWQGYLAASTLGWTSTWIGFPGVALLASVAVLWRAKRPTAIIGGIALLVLPVAWALSPVFSAANLTLPSASLPRWLGLDDGRGPILSRQRRTPSDDPRLLAFLQQHRDGTRFLVATPTALLAAPVVIRTGEPVLPFGGYLGNDPIMTVEDFAGRVQRGEVRFVVLGPARRPLDFDTWVRTHGVPVDPTLWRSLPPVPRRNIVLYDVAPAR